MQKLWRGSEKVCGKSLHGRQQVCDPDKML